SGRPSRRPPSILGASGPAGPARVPFEVLDWISFEDDPAHALETGPMTRPRPRRRTGFTLVELMVVILILAILVALLVPAILGAVRSAKTAAVATEINNLATALSDFKTKYGDYPPSRIILVESGFYDTSAAAYGTPLSSVTWYGAPP